jgi:monoamine oxidase
VTILEARDRCGGRIYTLPTEEFGYPAEGGPEFVHGAAPLTRALMREAGLALQPRGGTRWSTRSGALSPDESSMPHAGRFYQALSEVKADLPIAEFLEMHFAGRQYDELRRSITRTVEGYDAADPWRASTLALRDEWMARDDGEHGRIAGGYGALVDYLVSECRRHGAALHLGAAVTAIDEASGPIAVRRGGGATYEADAAILTVPPPLLCEIALPPAAREKAAVANADIGFGNVVKLLFLFATKWWANHGGRDLADLSFLLSDATVPTWWTQHPRKSGADRLVCGSQGRPGVVTYRGRAHRHGARLSRQDFRSTSGPYQQESRRVASDQLGQRSVRARRLFLRHAQDTPSAVGAEKIEW